ncbi:MAG: NUDIX domain-containing protein [Clostridia bacterium]|nr:NUDIX domain-containing protein [Clostridia bacterium]
MQEKTIKVVGTMFFKDGKLLIDKPRKRPTFQMIGGSVEEGETTIQAAIRECHEELGANVILDENCFEFVMDFQEIATSDQTTKIHFYVYKYNGELKGEVTTSEEIEKFMWFGIDDDINLLSNTLKNEVVPYCILKGLIHNEN